MYPRRTWVKNKRTNSISIEKVHTYDEIILFLNKTKGEYSIEGSSLYIFMSNPEVYKNMYYWIDFAANRIHILKDYDDRWYDLCGKFKDGINIDAYALRVQLESRGVKKSDIVYIKLGNTFIDGSDIYCKSEVFVNHKSIGQVTKGIQLDNKVIDFMFWAAVEVKKNIGIVPNWVVLPQVKGDFLFTNDATWFLSYEDMRKAIDIKSGVYKEGTIYREP